MEEDIPTAHSMDTTWFAVDENGLVGAFDTGEDGALPEEAAFGPGPSDASFNYDLLRLVQLGSMLEADEDPYDLEADPIVVADRTIVVVDPASPYRGWPDLPQWVDEAIEADELLMVRLGPPLVLLSREKLTEKRVEQIAKRNDVRWTYPLMDVGELLASEDDVVDGFFQFGRDHGDDPGRYERGTPPDKPIIVDDLIPELGSELSKLRLPVDFTEPESVHLADHQDVTESHTWGDLPLRHDETWPKESPRPAGQSGGAWRLIAIGIVILIIVLWLRSCD